MFNDFFQFRDFRDLTGILSYQSFSQLAGQLINTYDFHDIEKAKEHAKSVVPKIKGVSESEGIKVVDELFYQMQVYLKQNCKPIGGNHGRFW